jgi:hypothetical protein
MYYEKSYRTLEHYGLMSSGNTLNQKKNTLICTCGKSQCRGRGGGGGGGGGLLELWPDELRQHSFVRHLAVALLYLEHSSTEDRAR